MNRTVILLVTGLALALAQHAQAQPTKSDVARDIFIENSVTNFVLTTKAPEASGKSKVAFDLSVPDAGKYTLVCFVDGRPSKPVEFNAPGKFELNTRGLAPGTYRVTIQLIDSQARVGKVTKKIEVN